MQHDERNDVDVAVVFIKFGSSTSGSNPDHDEVVLRLLNPNRNHKLNILRVTQELKKSPGLELQ